MKKCILISTALLTKVAASAPKNIPFGDANCVARNITFRQFNRSLAIDSTRIDDSARKWVSFPDPAAQPHFGVKKLNPNAVTNSFLRTSSSIANILAKPIRALILGKRGVFWMGQSFGFDDRPNGIS